MRILIAVVIGVSVLFIPSAVAAQELPAGAMGPAMSVRMEVAQAGALARSDPEAAREAVARAVTSLLQVSEAATDDDAAEHRRHARGSLGAAEYAALADLAAQLDAPAGVRNALANGWLDRISADEPFRSAMTSRQLLALGRLVKIAEPKRFDAVLTLAAGQIERLQASPEPGVVAMCNVMETFALGGAAAAEDAHKTLERLTTKSGRFSKELAPFEIVRLAEFYTSAGNAAAAERLRAFVVREYLAEPGIAAAMRLTDWSELLDLLAGSRDDALRRAMVAAAVRHAGPSLAGARREAVADLLAKVERLGGTSNDINALATRWMGVAPGSADVAAIRAVLSSGDDQALRAAMVRHLDDRDAAIAAVEAAVKDRDDAVDDALRTLRQRHTAGQLDAAGYALACRLARESGSAAATAFWSAAALERFLASTGDGDDALALLEAAAGAGFAPPKETAEKLLARLREFQNTSWRMSDATLQSLAQACDRAGLADTLYKSITLPDGSGPDFIAVKLLAWIKREQKQIRPFIGELAGPTEKTRGDARARWELARAYAVSLIEPRAPRRTDGNGHIRLALQAARSDATLIMCLEELINACRPTNSYTFPLQVITSTKDRLEGQTRQRLEHLEQQLRNAATAAKPANTIDQPNWQTIFDNKRQQMQRG